MSDLINRQDAINAMMVLKRADDLAYGCEIPESFDSERAIEALKNIPSAEPERISMVWKPSKGRPAYEKGICNCGYVLSVLQRDFVYCPKCGAKLDWSE